jgi:hypothetical protein
VDPHRVEERREAKQIIQASIPLWKTRETMNMQLVDALIARTALRVAAEKMHFVPLEQRIADLLDAHIPGVVSVPDVADDHDEPSSAGHSDRYISRMLVADTSMENCPSARL